MMDVNVLPRNLLTGLFLFITSALLATPPSEFSGNWTLLSGQSDPIPLFGNVSLTVHRDTDHTDFCFTWGRGSRLFKDTLVVDQQDGQVRWLTRSRVFPYNVFLGIKVPESQKIVGKAHFGEEQQLHLERTYKVRGSQGKREVHETDLFMLKEQGNLLEWTVTIPELFGDTQYRYLFKKEGYRDAWLVYLSDNWKVKEALDLQAMLLSIQGLVNRESPKLYFIYPDNWDYRFTGDIYTFLRDEKHYSFTTINSVEKLIDTFHSSIKGYIVWDKEMPVTLDLAFTLAGLKDAIVISGDMIPLAEEKGLPLIDDLRGRYSGMNDATFFRKVYAEYGSATNKKMMVWLGGESGEVMKPGIADWGVMNRTFFTNLSTDPVDTAEYEMSKMIMQQQDPYGLIFGWHVYRKDKERDHVKLASSYGLRVEGLHTLPNLSFMVHVPVSPEYRFKNHHSSPEAFAAKPEPKVYISFVQTDCLGLGAWNQPGRGTIPYAWEVTMNWYWLAPAMLEYFYSEATDKDYFIGSLSGPGYIYPKAVPDKYLPVLVDSAYDLMKKLDLNVFEIMDYSEGATIEGNTELTRKVIQTYYDRMPQCMGFVNGYAPAFTFYVKQDRPLISYDYYLDPNRTVEEAVEDIRTLARLNPNRPYYLLIHVRQWNNIDKVNQIFSSLGTAYKVLPLDVFIHMAGRKPTFKEEILKERSH